MTITTIMADTNGATTTITTNAVEVKADAAPVKTVTEVKPNVAPVEPVVKATPAPAKATAASTKTASTPAKTAPPGYKLIKVKNADGKIIVGKKKLTEAELAAAAEKRGQTVTPDNTASEQTKSVEYKIVSIPQVGADSFLLVLPLRANALVERRHTRQSPSGGPR